MSTQGKNVVRSRVAGVGDGSLTTSAKYPWQDIRRDYVEGIEDSNGDLYFPTHADLAEKYGVKRRATIGQRAAEENWTEQRAAFRASLAKVRRRKRVLELSQEASKFDTSALAVSRVGMQLVQRRLGEIGQAVQEATRQENEHYQQTGTRKSILAGISARELRELGGAAEQFHSLAGRVFGDVEDTGSMLPQEAGSEQDAAREMTVTHEHTVRVERSTVVEVATVVAEIEAQVRQASAKAASDGHLPAEADPQEVIDAEIIDAQAS